MSTPYAGDPALFPAGVRLVDDGEPASAAFLGLCSQDLADRTAWLKAQLASVVAAPSLVQIKSANYQIADESIILCIGRSGAMTLTLPILANAPVGHSVLIVEGSNDGAHAINIVPHGTDTIYNTRTSITSGRDSVLAKKIFASGGGDTWVLYFLNDFDVHALNTRVGSLESGATIARGAPSFLIRSGNIPGHAASYLSDNAITPISGTPVVNQGVLQYVFPLPCTMTKAATLIDTALSAGGASATIELIHYSVASPGGVTFATFNYATAGVAGGPLVSGAFAEDFVAGDSLAVRATGASIGSNLIAATVTMAIQG